eukprot:jgi/Chrpa1/21782/Chrysochromulina_OHIO_Genome00027236-RA
MEGMTRPAVTARIKDEMQRAAENPMVLELENPSFDDAVRSAAAAAEIEAAKKAGAEQAAAVVLEAAATALFAAEPAAAEPAAVEKVEKRSLFVASIASPFESAVEEPAEPAAPAAALSAPSTLLRSVTFGPGPLGMVFGYVDGCVTILSVTPGSQAEQQGVAIGSKVISVAGIVVEGMTRAPVMSRIKDEMQRAAEKPMVLELVIPSIDEAARAAVAAAEIEAAKKAAAEQAAAVEQAAAEKATSEQAAVEKAASEMTAAEAAAAEKAAAEKAAVELAAAEQVAAEKAAADVAAAEQAAAELAAAELAEAETVAAEKVEKHSSFFGGLAAAIASPFESTHEVPAETAAPAGSPARSVDAPASPRRTVTFGPGRLGLTFGDVDGCTIHSVAPGSSGAAQGVVVGSKVVSVAGKPTEGVPYAEVVALIKEEMQHAAEKPMSLELESEAYAEPATATEDVNSVAPAASEQAAIPADANPLSSILQAQEGDDYANMEKAVKAPANHVAPLKTGTKRMSLLGGLTAAANAAATVMAAPFENKKEAVPATPPAGPPAELFADLDATVLTSTLRRTATFGPGPLGMAFGYVDGCVTILSVTPGSQAEQQGVAIGSKVISVAGETMEGMTRAPVMSRIKDEMQRAAEKPMVLELEIPSVDEVSRAEAAAAKSEAAKRAAASPASPKPSPPVTASSPFDDPPGG